MAYPQIECRQEFWQASYSSTQAFGGGRSLILQVLSLSASRFVSLLLLKLAGDALNFAAPLLLGAFVTCMTSSHAQAAAGCSSDLQSSCSNWGRTAHPGTLCFQYAALLSGVAAVKAVANAQYTYQLERLETQVYIRLASAPLQAILGTPAYAMARFSAGAISSSMRGQGG